MRAVGADPVTTGLDGLIGIVASILVGSVLAVAVALALSPLFPIGPVRPVYPDRGVNADWTVLGAGFAVLFGVLAAVAVVIAFLEAPHRVQRRARFGARRSSTVQLAARSGLPPSAVAGASFAVDARHGRAAGPYRWALLSAVIAMIVVTTTLTFGASLHTLVSQPALYGWNWDYAVQSSDGYGPVPNKAVAMLRHDRAVTSFSGVSFVTMQLDGVEVPTLLADPGSPGRPPIISGHGLATSRQIVLGAATLAQLHKRIGDTVDLRYVPGYRAGPSGSPSPASPPCRPSGSPKGSIPPWGSVLPCPPTRARSPRVWARRATRRLRRAQHGPLACTRGSDAPRGGQRRSDCPRRRTRSWPGNNPIRSAGKRRHRPLRAASRPDRELPLHGHDPVLLGAGGSPSPPSSALGLGARGLGAAVPP